MSTGEGPPPSLLVRPLAFQSHDVCRASERRYRVDDPLMAVTLGNNDDDLIDVMHRGQPSGGFGNPQIDADRKHHQHRRLASPTERCGGLRLDEAWPSDEQRRWIERVEPDDGRVSQRLGAKPPRPHEASDRMWGGTANAVRSHKLDHPSKRRRMVTVGRKGCGCELIVGTDTDVDAALAFPVPHPCDLEAIDLAQPHPMISNHIEAGLGQNGAELYAVGWTGNRRRFDRNGFEGPFDRPPNARRRVTEPLRSDCQRRVRIIEDQIHDVAPLGSRPDQRCAEHPAGGVGEVQPALISGAHRRATAEA